MSSDVKRFALKNRFSFGRVAVLLGLAELAVVVVVLAPDGVRGWDLAGFMRASGFALWLALAVSVMLCRMRRNLSSRPPRIGEPARSADQGARQHR